MSVFGTLHHGGQAEDAVLQTFTTWLPDYLAEVSRQDGLPAGTLEQPKSWEFAADVTKWPESQLPCVLVVAPGTEGQPWREGSGYYRARYRVNVTVICSAGGDNAERDTRRLAQLYGAVIRGVLLQHRKLSNNASVVAWAGEGYDQVPQQDRRTLGFALNAFLVELRGIVSDSAGPQEPTADPVGTPPSDWPAAASVQVDVEPKES